MLCLTSYQKFCRYLSIRPVEVFGTVEHVLHKTRTDSDAYICTYIHTCIPTEKHTEIGANIDRHTGSEKPHTGTHTPV